MIFIYLFFGIGVLATLIMMLPSILEVYTFIVALFKNLKQAKKDKIEVREATLKLKKDLKLEKINKKYGDPEEIEVEDKVEVEEVKEVEDKEEVDPVAEQVAEPEVETTEVRTEILNNPYINTNDTHEVN